MATYRLFFFLLFIPFIKSQAQVLTDPSEAFTAAQSAGKPVLLVFSGSDWCAPCIRFDRDVLSDSTFIQYAEKHIIVLKADFPQRKKIAQPLQSAYEKLADTYNPEGAFPKLLLISPDKKNVATIPFLKQTPATFVAELQRILN